MTPSNLSLSLPLFTRDRLVEWRREGDRFGAGKGKVIKLPLGMRKMGIAREPDLPRYFSPRDSGNEILQRHTVPLRNRPFSLSVYR